MKVLIDADSISYLIGWDVKDLEQTPDNYGTVLAKTDNFMMDLLRSTKATEYMGFLGGVHPTFRHMMNREYKANRGLTKPDWWNQWGGIINHRLRHYWKFYYVEGIEAEDAVGIMAHHEQYNACIAHIDKDLNQIPGWHYNYKNLVKYSVDSKEAAYNLFKQVMTGDATDNLPGLPGVGPVKAEQVLAPGNNETDYMYLTLNKFCKQFGQREGLIKFTESYAMVKLLDECPSELTFKPAEYQFQTVDVKQYEFLLNNSPDESETSDYRKYFVQQDTSPEGKNQQVPE